MLIYFRIIEFISSVNAVLFPPLTNYCEILIFLFPVNFPVVGGGFALLTTTATALGGAAATAPILPLLLAPLGLVGVAGTAGLAVMAISECGGPRLCVSLSGQCCELLISTAGPICPTAC